MYARMSNVVLSARTCAIATRCGQGHTQPAQVVVGFWVPRQLGAVRAAHRPASGDRTPSCCGDSIIVEGLVASPLGTSPTTPGAGPDNPHAGTAARPAAVPTSAAAATEAAVPGPAPWQRRQQDGAGVAPLLGPGRFAERERHRFHGRALRLAGPAGVRGRPTSGRSWTTQRSRGRPTRRGKRCPPPDGRGCSHEARRSPRSVCPFSLS